MDKIINKEIIIENDDVSSIYIKTLEWMNYYGFKKIRQEEYISLNGLYHFSKPRYAKYINFKFNKEDNNVKIEIRITPMDENYRISKKSYYKIISNYIDYMNKNYILKIFDEHIQNS